MTQKFTCTTRALSYSKRKLILCAITVFATISSLHAGEPWVYNEMNNTFCRQSQLEQKDYESRRVKAKEYPKSNNTLLLQRGLYVERNRASWPSASIGDAEFRSNVTQPQSFTPPRTRWGYVTAINHALVGTKDLHVAGETVSYSGPTFGILGNQDLFCDNYPLTVKSDVMYKNSRIIILTNQALEHHKKLIVISQGSQTHNLLKRLVDEEASNRMSLAYYDAFELPSGPTPKFLSATIWVSKEKGLDVTGWTVKNFKKKNRPPLTDKNDGNCFVLSCLQDCEQARLVDAPPEPPQFADALAAPLIIHNEAQQQQSPLFSWFSRNTNWFSIRDNKRMLFSVGLGVAGLTALTYCWKYLRKK